MPLINVDEWLEHVASYDSLSSLTVSMDGTSGIAQFVLPPGWNIGIEGMDSQEITKAVMGVNGQDYRLTKEAILDICHSIGLTPKYVSKTPGPLVQSHLNYWATHSPDTEIRLLVKDDVAMVVTKAGITPFPNSEILSTAITELMNRYNLKPEDIGVDSKSHHSLTQTVTRLVIPDSGIVFEDDWRYGVQIVNSLVGAVPLSVQGYLFHSEGGGDLGIITQATEGKYNRKVMGQEFSEVLAWVKQATENATGMLPTDVDTLEHAVGESIAGTVSPILADTFKTYKVPLKARQPIMDAMIEDEEFTYYGLVRAISGAANLAQLPEHMVTGLMEIAGDLAKHVSERCNSCHRVLV